MSAQLCLLDRAARIPSFDGGFAGLRRRDLGAEAWIDYAQRWLSAHQSMFEILSATTRWHGNRRHMYERVVEVPRLTASLPTDGPGHALILEAATALQRRYGVPFDRIGLALYRDGRDSVAWHGDKVLRDRHDAHVAIVSIGAPRPFRLRPKVGGSSIVLRPGWGDLLVMGGSCQRTWEHCVPKTREAGPRISIMFRSSEEGRYP